MSKEKKKHLKRSIGWLFVRTSVAISGSLPLGFNYFLGFVLGNIAYFAIVRHRRIAIESLGIAFPSKSLKERKEIARNFFIFIAQGSFELLFYLKNPDKINSVRIEGKNNLDNALAKGKGVIIVTAHIGSFPLLSLKLAQKKVPVHFITRPMRDKRVGDYLFNLRSNAGVKTIYSYPRRECVNNIIQALRANEVVILQMDQNFGTGGVWVKFFGKLAATPVGPISLALRTKAAVVPAYIYQEKNKAHCIKIFPEEQLVITDNKDETILKNVITLTGIIQTWVTKHPCQWSWIHKRWKSRPSKKIFSSKFKIEE
jgi:Kdo2-lipid IVA lauroyltransferase/acyltransferase